jgi:anthranilate synthase/aminodeoxychorismate synthase-like glutamine amidotransferase
MTAGARARLLVVDNYDSFTHNLAHGLAAAGATVEVVRNDAVALDEVLAMGLDGVVLSPGPGHPAVPRDFGVCAALVKDGGSLPLFGVCLGLQGMAHHTGGRVVRAPAAVHGQSTRVGLEPHPLFAGLPRSIAAGRYHSLVAEEASLPADWRVIARGDGLVMAMAHQRRPMAGVQFHPESILTPQGPRLLRNVVEWCRGATRPGAARP